MGEAKRRTTNGNGHRGDGAGLVIAGGLEFTCSPEEADEIEIAVALSQRGIPAAYMPAPSGSPSHDDGQPMKDNGSGLEAVAIDKIAADYMGHGIPDRLPSVVNIKPNGNSEPAWLAAITADIARLTRLQSELSAQLARLHPEQSEKSNPGEGDGKGKPNSSRDAHGRSLIYHLVKWPSGLVEKIATIQLTETHVCDVARTMVFRRPRAEDEEESAPESKAAAPKKANCRQHKPLAPKGKAAAAPKKKAKCWQYEPLAPGLPKAMLSRIEPWNRKTS